MCSCILKNKMCSCSHRHTQQPTTITSKAKTVSIDKCEHKYINALITQYAKTSNYLTHPAYLKYYSFEHVSVILTQPY